MLTRIGNVISWLYRVICGESPLNVKSGVTLLWHLFINSAACARFERPLKYETFKQHINPVNAKCVVKRLRSRMGYGAEQAPLP